MLAARPLAEKAFETWTTSTLKYIAQTFGEESNHLYTFIGSMRYGGGGDSEYGYDDSADAEHLRQRIEVLDSLIAEIDTELSFAVPATEVSVEDFWSRLHPSVVQIAKPRFDAGLYADAVEAAFKDLNVTIKAFMKSATNQECDGADLMLRVFSPNAPVARLADLSTDDGQNMQKGYMQIFAGAMTGIRNPKAHSNVIIDAKRAIHHLHLASLLRFVFDERI